MWSRTITDPSTTNIVYIGGRWMRDVNRTISKEKLQRMRDGYMCLNCEEPLKEAFPDVCPLRGCGYEIKKYQLQDLESRYKGEDEERNEFVRNYLEDQGVWLP